MNNRKPERNDLPELNHLQRYLVEEYVEDYQEGALTRRQALKYIGAVLGSMAAASSLLAACAPATTGAPQATSAPAATTGATATTAATATAAATATVGATATADQAAEATVMATNTVVATEDTSPVATPGPSNASVPEDDPDIQAQMVTFPGDGLDVIAYLARPAGDEPRPAILVCHENRGLTDHIKDVTRRLAKAGYVGLAVDLLSGQGGTEKVTDPAQIPSTLGSASPDELAGYFISGIDYLAAQPFVEKDRYGMTGFCFGGGMTWLVATKEPRLKAAVPYYGPNPPLDAVPNIQAAVLAIYGAEDERINAGIPAIEEAMKQNGKTFEMVIYEGAGHAFNNDTGRNYNPDAAADAWAKTLAWFEKYV